jgi:PAS domain S-box-containing protein
VIGFLCPLVSLSTWRLRYRLVELCAFVSSALLCVVSAFALGSPESEKSVLVLYGERGDLPAIEAVEENLREVFHGSRSPPIELFSEYLDFARFSGSQQETTLVRYLQDRYAGRRIDLVMPVAGSALEFALSHRVELFPAAPMVFCATDQRELENLALPADVTGIVGHFDIERTIDLIFQLQPDVSEIVCVSGTSGFDRRWADETRKVLERMHSRISARWIIDKSLAATIDEVSRVPKTSAVLFVSMLRDGAGQSTSSVDAVRDLALVSKAPIYGPSSQFLNAGVVGGAMFDFGLNGRNAAELALKALRGQWVHYGSPETESHNPLLINWQALKKAGLPEQRVPAGAELRLQPPGLWETHRLFISVAFVAVILQAILIAGLVLERFLRRKAEASLRQSEERMSLAAEAANLGVWIWDVDRNEVWTTDKGRTLLGFTPDERVDYAALTARVHPEDRGSREAAIHCAMNNGGEYAMEYRVLLPDGTLRWIGSRGHFVRGDRIKTNRLIGVWMDVTGQKKAQEALRESEARFRAMADTAPVLIWMSGTDKLCTFFNKGWLDFTGRSLEQELGNGWAEGVHREDLDRCLEVYITSFEKRRPFTMEYRLRRRDGEYRWILDSGGPRFAPDDTFLGYIGSCIDITEHKQAEEEARIHREELAHLSRVAIMGEMAGSLAHELNQPLTGIVNNSSAGRRFIAKRRADPRKLDSLFEAICEDGRRAGGIIRGIRCMVQKGNYVRSAVNLNDVIASVLRLVHSDALERHCALITEADPKLPLVMGDQVQLQQVLLNLIMNAFDAMGETPPAQRRVIIRSERISGGRVRVSVRDFGTGLSVENPERIFEHFFSTKQNGLGMGLAIVRSIITSHDGELAAVNAEGGGTCAYFSLPGIGEDTHEQAEIAGFRS